jgi:hypothetical protein
MAARRTSKSSRVARVQSGVVISPGVFRSIEDLKQRFVLGIKEYETHGKNRDKNECVQQPGNGWTLKWRQQVFRERQRSFATRQDFPSSRGPLRPNAGLCVRWEAGSCQKKGCAPHDHRRASGVSGGGYSRSKAGPMPPIESGPLVRNEARTPFA